MNIHEQRKQYAMKTRREVEATICDGISQFEQEFMGRGPKDIRTHLIGDGDHGEFRR